MRAARRKIGGHRAFPSKWTMAVVAVTAMVVATIPGVMSSGAAAAPKDPGRWNLVATTSVRIFYYQGMTARRPGELLLRRRRQRALKTDSSLTQIAGTTPVHPGRRRRPGQVQPHRSHHLRQGHRGHPADGVLQRHQLREHRCHRRAEPVHPGLGVRGEAGPGHHQESHVGRRLPQRQVAVDLVEQQPLGLRHG